ncbi:unnamed protein product [Acanthoscelides obtectus]|uniref:Uncharacterized protein n=1 Tax=Acanthoscelides obtectus TaxID=200917 RepID=A0A9P0L4V8_ACAOB|nr:unnamed protein product [Acanthoscelides obtectus]CAK1620330.1 hypothetical protein AOBTE_LOCUS315 [Acanthoscelides obtectus]
MTYYCPLPTLIKKRHSRTITPTREQHNNSKTQYRRTVTRVEQY